MTDRTSDQRTKWGVSRLLAAILMELEDYFRDIVVGAISQVVEMQGLINDTDLRTLRVDRSTHTLQTINYEHHEIHGGSNYRVQHNDDAIPAKGAGGELVIAFFVPDGVKQPHMIWEFVHEGNMTCTLLEGITFNASAGTDRTCRNSNRNVADNSFLQGKATGALVSGVVTVGEQSADTIYAGGTPVSVKRNYAAKNQPGEGARRQEVILKTNTNYAIVLDNNETSTQGGQIRLEWYEHTPKD